MFRSVVPTVAGGLAILSVLAGCSHTGSGQPAPSDLRTATAPGRAAPPPSDGATKAADLPLCRDFVDVGGRRGNIRPGDRYSIAVWQKVARDAPPVIRPDAETVARYVANAHGVPEDPTSAAVTRALRRVSDWVTANCI